MDGENVLECRGLQRSFGKLVAVRHEILLHMTRRDAGAELSQCGLILQKLLQLLR